LKQLEEAKKQSAMEKRKPIRRREGSQREKI
jgi:hypothetical protein